MKTAIPIPTPANPRPRSGQRGAALLIAMLIVVLGLVTLLTFRSDRKGPEMEAERKTALALAQAKEALLGYAAGVALSPSDPDRPGDLPCPDLDNDGVAEPTSCGNAAGSTGQDRRLGRLPWRTLGLPDLRDGYGERLWYAVSNNFKKNTRTSILNSDTPGTITVRDSGGNLVLDGSGAMGAIAVIFSPGSAITLENGYAQNRVCVPCDAQEKCMTNPATSTPRCNPANYLDNALGEDNKNFVDNNPNGFIQGLVINAASRMILNDKLIAITREDLMPLLEKRVAGEVLFCLTEYAAESNNQGRYPWAAPLNLAATPTYFDASEVRFGRIPDTPFTKTNESSSNAMNLNWGACNFVSGSPWWRNWKEMVFYAVADAYKPVDLSTPPVPAPVCGVPDDCLTVNLPSAATNRQVAVFLAGRRLGNQQRTSPADKGNIANYLENQNATPADNIFQRSLVSGTFNDVILFTPK